MNKALLDRAINEFDIINFLEENNIDFATEGKNIGTGWIGVNSCPNCGDSKYHWGINIQRKYGKCWVCGHYKSLENIIANILSISRKRAIVHILENSGITEDDIELQIDNIINPEKFKPKTQEIKSIVNIPKGIPVYKLFNKNEAVKEFCLKKKITYGISILTKLLIATTGEHKGRLIIPIYYNKQLVAYQARSLVERYFKNVGLVKHYLYQYSMIKKHSRIILVEGYTDWVSTFSFLNSFRKRKYSLTTPFSKLITEEQLSLLERKEPKEVIFMLDNDAWYNYLKPSQKLSCNTNFIILPHNSDPGKLTNKQFMSIFEENNL